MIALFGYEVRLVSGGTPPYSLRLIDGTSPAGMVLRTDGYLAGMPRAPGTFAFRVRAADSAGATAEASFRANVSPSNVNGAPREQARLNTARATITPGAVDRSVTSKTLRATICSRSWVARRTPSRGYMAKARFAAMRRYNFDEGAYVADHLIPIELGGAAKSPRNIWPESANRAREADQLEHRLNRAVCAGAMTLRSAQRRIVQTKRVSG
jgi:hypothetical protein